MNAAIELVVFDIAGTTIKDNGEIASAFQCALHEFGYEVPLEKINPLMGYKKTEAIKRMLIEYEENEEKISRRLINRIHNRFLQLMVEHYSTTDQLTSLPNAEEVFSKLRALEIKIALNTGFPKEITDVIMERTGWIRNNTVDEVISSSEVPSGRPSSHMIQELMKRTSVTDPKKVVKVGDTEVDVAEGRNAGCLYSIGVTTGAFRREELEHYYPSYIIDDLLELLPIVESHQ
ncbi:MAG TPA: HAD hydrolase-like protein [Chitinophagaceae bacterium]|nr:HAD hydrolase-like protein [Chitinophagaceae bacterium]